MSTFDIIVVATLVVLSALYLIRLAMRSLRGTKKGKGCDHCSS